MDKVGASDPGPGSARSQDLQRALLVLDNTSFNRDRMRSLLGDDVECLFVASEEAALLIARAYAPDLVLLEGKQSERDGCRLCRRMKAIVAMADVPVLVLTPSTAFN